MARTWKGGENDVFMGWERKSDERGDGRGEDEKPKLRMIKSLNLRE